VALEEVAMASGRGAAVSGVLGDLVRPDSGNRAVKEVVMVGRRGMVMEKLSVGGRCGSKGYRTNGERDSET
jgi:hypothetical protein